MSGVLHEAMSLRGTTGNTQVQSPLNATTATGKETQQLAGGEGEMVKWVGGRGVVCSWLPHKPLSKRLGPGDASYSSMEKTNEIRVPPCIQSRDDTDSRVNYMSIS